MFNKFKASAYLAVIVAGWSFSGLSAAQEDGGQDTVIAAQEDAAPVSIEPAAPYPEDVLTDWVRSKGWGLGWDSEKNRFIYVEVVEGRIRPNQRSFLDKRAALYTELELRLKAKIIESLFTEVDASVILDVPGNPIAAQLEALKGEYDAALEDADAAIYEAYDDFTDVLEAEEKAAIDALEGVTFLDRANAILDGIAKRLDETYNSAAIDQAKKERAAELKMQLNEAAQKVVRAINLKKELEKQADAQIKAISGDYAASQETSVKSFSKMPLLGAVMLKTAETYDGKRDYKIAGVMAWSPKLQKDASDLLLGTAEPKPRPSKKTMDEWIASLDLSSMIGTRRYLAADGSVNFVGFAAAEYDPEDSRKNATIRAFADQQAKGLAVLSMKADVEVTRLAETKTFDVDTDGGRETFTFANMSEELMQSTNGAVAVQGLVSPGAKRLVHQPSGKDIFVSYAYINSDVAAKSEAFREETGALERWINEDQSARRGRESGRRAAATATKNDANAYSEGYKEGKAGVEATDAANRAAAAPAPEAQRPAPGPAPAPTATGQTQSGTFIDDTDVEDDF